MSSQYWKYQSRLFTYLFCLILIIILKNEKTLISFSKNNKPNIKTWKTSKKKNLIIEKFSDKLL